VCVWPSQHRVETHTCVYVFNNRVFLSVLRPLLVTLQLFEWVNAHVRAFHTVYVVINNRWIIFRVAVNVFVFFATYIGCCGRERESVCVYIYIRLQNDARCIFSSISISSFINNNYNYGINNLNIGFFVIKKNNDAKNKQKKVQMQYKNTLNEQCFTFF